MTLMSTAISWEKHALPNWSPFPSFIWIQLWLFLSGDQNIFSGWSMSLLLICNKSVPYPHLLGVSTVSDQSAAKGESHCVFYSSRDTAGISSSAVLKLILPVTCLGISHCLTILFRVSLHKCQQWLLVGLA